MFYALIGDMIGSRALSSERRYAAQCALAFALDAVNNEQRAGIAAKFVITLGDEFQGLMNADACPLAAVTCIARRMSDIPIRFAIGIGDITTPIRSDAAIGADGPAFYNARAAVDALKSDGGRLRVCTGDEAVDEELCVITSLMDALARGRTNRQLIIVSEMLSAELSNVRLTQCELAQRLGVTQGTVSSALSASSYRVYSHGMKYIDKRMKNIVGGI